jgi:outer membrane murein-binding lipoprotein Lpp
MNAEASERVIQVNKLSTAISDMNEKHNKDISELYKDSNQKYEKILNEISSVNQKVSRLEGKVMQ